MGFDDCSKFLFQLFAFLSLMCTVLSVLICVFHQTLNALNLKILNDSFYFQLHKSDYFTFKNLTDKIIISPFLLALMVEG